MGATSLLWPSFIQFLHSRTKWEWIQDDSPGVFRPAGTQGQHLSAPL